MFGGRKETPPCPNVAPVVIWSDGEGRPNDDSIGWTLRRANDQDESQGEKQRDGMAVHDQAMLLQMHITVEKSQ